MFTEEQRAHFHERGFAHLGKVWSDEQFAQLRQRCTDITQGRVLHPSMWFQKDIGGDEYKLAPGGKFQGPSDNYRKIEGWEVDPVFLAYMQDPVFRGITREWIGGSVSIYRAMFMNKPPNKGTVLPYHQDGGDGWRLSSAAERDFLTIWTAVDDAVVANGCVEVVPGSHKLGLLSKRGHTISKEHESKHAENADSVFLELKAGEVVALHNFLLHRSGVNETPNSRRGFSVCYINGAIHRTNDPEKKPFPRVFGPDALKVEDAEARMAEAAEGA